MALKVQDVRERFKSNPPGIKALVGGQPGAGKTLFASTWPNVLYADAEGRLLSVRNRNVRAIDVHSTHDLDELRAALAQAPEVRAKLLGGPVETVCLDTVDEISKLIIKERLKSEKQEVMRMADWGYLGDTLRTLLRGFRNLPIHVLFNVHLKTDTDSETGRVWESPAIQGAVGAEIAGYVDEAWLMVARPIVDAKSGQRVLSRHLQTFPDAQHTWVKDHSGCLPYEFPVNFADDYDRLSKIIFADDTPPARPAAPAVARATSVATTPTVSVNATTPTVSASEVSGTGSVSMSVSEPVLEEAPVPAPILEPESVPDAGTVSELSAVLDAEEAEVEMIPCADCGKPLHPVEDKNQIDLSKMRYQVALCRESFVERKAAKSRKP